MAVWSAMKKAWRSFRRWFPDYRERMVDLTALLLVCATGAFMLQRLDPGPSWSWLSVFIVSGAGLKWLLWLLLVMVCLVAYAVRRWLELDGLLMEADTDALTTLNNRRKTERLLAQEFDRAVRYQRPLSVIMVDIDHFKRVNDKYGHATGDTVLATVARRMRHRTRASDHLGRWGGEEFMVICPETELAEAQALADRIRRAIKHRVVGEAGFVTASFGVSSQLGQADYEALVEEADNFLYMAKRRGRDRAISRLTLPPEEAALPKVHAAPSIP
jgi:diguanylate cyclase (GGDEF)-like protein